MPQIKRKTKFVAAANLLSLSVQDVIKYVQKLHQHIAKQNKRIKKLKLKITKMVNKSLESDVSSMIAKSLLALSVIKAF